MPNIIAIGGGGNKYQSGTLTTIDNSNKINVNMTKSTPANIEQESRDNPNVLFFTEGSPGGGTTINSSSITLDHTLWDSSNTIDVTVSGISANSNILVAPAPLSIDDYTSCRVYALSQATNTIIFKCATIPSVDISVNIAFWE
jgi:hypothetical protein